MKILFLVFISVNVFGQVIPKPSEVDFKKNYLNLNNSSISVRAYCGYSNGRIMPQSEISLKLLKSFLPDIQEDSAEFELLLIYPDDYYYLNSYMLEIKKNGIHISGNEKTVFQGIQTLRQLMAQSNGKLQCQTIIDSAAFAWRGMHLDCSRHFFDVAFIKKYIDILALHKMNTFHWHLTDDQGWRIEIKKYPKLTEIGSQRKETIIGKNFDPYKGDRKPYGGYYTQEQIKEVVAYAAERYITVVPEIEMPGHAVAALSAYPQFSCRQQPLETLTKWGVSDDIYCSKDSTFDFIFDVLDEVLELFPSNYVHIGGDEAPKTRWKECAHCQANIKKHNLKDEHELQSYFIGRVDSFLSSKGRKTIGWDEILEGGLAPNAAVMSWRGEKGGIAAARQKHNVVMSPGSHCYFDHYQGDIKTEPLAIGGYTPLKKVYDYHPIPNDLEKKYHKYILGAQGNVWTEYMETPEQVMYMALPRLCALSEVLWSGPSTSSYYDFTQRLIPHFSLLDSLGYNYSKALFNIYTLTITSDEKLSVSLESDFPEYEIRYTMDSSQPNAQSTLFKKPISINNDFVLKAQHFKNGNALGNTFSREYKYHLALGKKLDFKNPPNEHYKTGGAQTLINGVIGSLPWSGNEWLGWRGEAMEATLDLGLVEEVHKIKVSFLQAKESWIYLPKQVHVYVGRSEESAKRIELTKSGSDHIYEGDINQYAQVLSIKAIPLNSIPKGNPGAGQKPWLFCSEIMVE